MGPVAAPPVASDPFDFGIPGVGPPLDPREEFPDGIPGIASPLPPDHPALSGDDDDQGGAGSAGVGVIGGTSFLVGLRTFGAMVMGAGLTGLASILSLSGSSTAPPRRPEETALDTTPPDAPEAPGAEDDLTQEELAMAFGSTEADREPVPMAGAPVGATGTPPSLAEPPDVTPGAPPTPATPLGPVTGVPPHESDPLGLGGIPGFAPAPGAGEEFPDGIPGIASPLPVDDPLRADGDEDAPPVAPDAGTDETATTSAPRPLPDGPEGLLEQGYTETTHPAAAENGHRTFEKDGETIRFDEGDPNKPGHAGRDHFHRDNPNMTGKQDRYLDRNGNPVAKGSDASHLYPGD